MGAQSHSRKTIVGFFRFAYHPVFHYINGEEMAESIAAFSRQQHASLIITVPKNIISFGVCPGS
ncbi:MAG: hypothetical protein JWM28_1880, partial [Chitinophagaceae bacterium]|nr:hypothetical protein [Chitinophagaceae bacterium]